MACDSAAPEAAHVVLPEVLPGSAAAIAADATAPAAAAAAEDAMHTEGQLLDVEEHTTATVIQVAAAAQQPPGDAAVAAGFTSSAPAHLARLAAAFKPSS